MLKATAHSIAKGTPFSSTIQLNLGQYIRNGNFNSAVVPKGKDSNKPSNYRPISLPSILSKPPLALQQWRFHFRRSIISALLDATHQWFQSTGRSKEVCAICFDLCEAFDSVPHWLLLQKLVNWHQQAHSEMVIFIPVRQRTCSL